MKPAFAASETNQNRRRHYRYGFSTQLKYKVVRNGATLLAGRGTTVDMAAGGILVSLDRPVPVGARIELSLEWPGLYHGRDAARLHVTGQVIRDGQPGSTALSAAVRILHHQFVASGAVTRSVTAVANGRRQLAVA